MFFTDSHCHLTMADANVVLTRARDRGVRGFVVPATKLDDAQQSIDIANANDDVWCAVGFHPHEAKEVTQAHLDELARLAQHPKVIAWGEIGLDYFYDHSPRDTQAKVFRQQMELAKAAKKPALVAKA